jgi:hypothetical protein
VLLLLLSQTKRRSVIASIFEVERLKLS